MKYFIFFLVWLFLVLVSCNDGDDDDAILIEETVIYKIFFDPGWTVISHPTDYPANAHFSWMVGVAHKKNDIMFRNGDVASDGMEQMAETGLTALISEELDVEIQNGNALMYNIGNVIDGDGIDEIMVNASVEHSLFSFVSMIAPSPDWFVANTNISLIQNGDWVESLTFYFVSYDAGTDSGLEFTSTDIDSNPREPIFMIVNPPLGNGIGVEPSLGQIRIVKQ